MLWAALSPCPRASAVTPGLKHPSVHSGRSSQGPSATAGRRTGCLGRTPARKAPGRTTKGSVDGGRASRCRGVGGPRSVSPSSRRERRQIGSREPGAYGSHPRPQSTPTCASGGQVSRHPPVPPCDEGFLESPGFARPLGRLRILCPAGLERLLAPGARGQEGAPGRRRVAGKGGSERRRQFGVATGCAL